MERKKRKVVAIHTIPCHGSTLRKIIEKNNGKLLMIVREPVQTLDSQFSLHSNNFLSEGIERRKIYFYYDLAKIPRSVKKFSTKHYRISR